MVDGRVVGARRCSPVVFLLLVLQISSSPCATYRLPAPELNVQTPIQSSASTAEILRTVQKILFLRKVQQVHRNKFAKQEEAGDGAANALATLTDSFGGMLAGQIVSVILSAVTGDVRGILGNSLNLFQTDDRRDRVQYFLDDLSQNFLKFTGLGALTSTASPQGTQPGGAAANGQVGQLQGFKPGQVAQLGQGGVSGAGGGGVVLGGVGGTGATGQQSPVIYVLPQLNGAGAGGGTAGVGTAGTGTATKVNTGTTPNRGSSGGGDEESEEDR